MSALRRLLPHPALSASLFVIWLVLNASLEPRQIVLGALLGVAVPLLILPLWPDRPPFHRLPRLWRLFLIVNWDILIASLSVAWLTLTRPAGRLQPQFIVIPLDCRNPYGMAILTGIVSMTPGTVAADLDAEHRLLLVHALHERDPAGAAARIKSRYEQPIREVLG
jgi:multicomponent K+:H+ antiporter subunit E